MLYGMTSRKDRKEQLRRELSQKWENIQKAETSHLLYSVLSPAIREQSQKQVDQAHAEKEQVRIRLLGVLVV